MKNKIENTEETKKEKKSLNPPLSKRKIKKKILSVSPQEKEENNQRKTKKKKYKIDYKKLGFLIGGVVLLVGIIWGGTWLFKSKKSSNETKIYDVLVQLVDQKSYDLEKDAKNSAKKGDVILIRETGQEWSKTEKISYLILKMELNEKQAQKIVQSKSIKLSKDEAKAKGLVNDERLKNMEKEELKQILKEDVLFREYRIKIEELDFDPMKVRNEQPFKDEVFGWSLVEKKD